jgi:hypothetical protein
VAAAAGPSSPFGTYAGNSRTDLHRAMCAENSTPQERKREREKQSPPPTLLPRYLAGVERESRATCVRFEWGGEARFLFTTTSAGGMLSGGPTGTKVARTCASLLNRL